MNGPVVPLAGSVLSRSIDQLVRTPVLGRSLDASIGVPACTSMTCLERPTTWPAAIRACTCDLVRVMTPFELP